eukprot:g3928.t1
MSRSNGVDSSGRIVVKRSVLDLAPSLDKRIHVKLSGGREVEGTLKGYDDLVNLVLDNATEYMKDRHDSYTMTGEKRTLGLVVCRGTQVTLITPVDGLEPISNPFADDNEEEDAE